MIKATEIRSKMLGQLGISFYKRCSGLLWWVVAHCGARFNKKIALRVEGNRGLFPKLEGILKRMEKGEPVILFHAASAGEFEQIRPIIERSRLKLKSLTIVVSFFSASGFNAHREYPHADLVIYLPWDTPGQMRKFIQKLRPSLIVLDRYELWPNLLLQAECAGIPIWLINATFSARGSTMWSRFLKSFYCILYEKISWIGCATANDRQYIEGILGECLHSGDDGDTRFDRVSDLLQRPAERPRWLPADRVLLIAGSTHRDDEKILFPVLSDLLHKGTALAAIVVPHETDTQRIAQIERDLKYFRLVGCRLSCLKKQCGSSAAVQVLVVDCIGILSSLYRFSDVVFLGGSFRREVHNVLEPAIFGRPIIVGPYIENSEEAKRLVAIGGAIQVRKLEELSTQLLRLIKDHDHRQRVGTVAKLFTCGNQGASDRIIHRIADCFPHTGGKSSSGRGA